MSSLEQWGVILVIFAAVVYFMGDSVDSVDRKLTKLDKIFKKGGQFLKVIGSVMGAIIGIIFILVTIASWLGFFGIIPYGYDSSDGRYYNEMNDPFR